MSNNVKKEYKLAFNKLVFEWRMSCVQLSKLTKCDHQSLLNAKKYGDFSEISEPDFKLIALLCDRIDEMPERYRKDICSVINHRIRGLTVAKRVMSRGNPVAVWLEIKPAVEIKAALSRNMKAIFNTECGKIEQEINIMSMTK